MPEKKVKITGLPSTYIWGNDKFGPFTASEEKPYVEVPASFASALGLSLYDPEPAADPEPQASEPVEGTGITLLGQTEDALRTVLDAQAQIADLFPEFKGGDLLTTEAGPHPLVEAVQEAIQARDQLQARVTELETAANAPAQQPQVPEGAQLLPADARERLIAIDGIGEVTADLVLAALTVPSVVASDVEPAVTVSDDAPVVAQVGDTVATQKTGDLPHNVVGAGKLKAIGITTWEGVREATDQALTDAGLEADQITKLRTLSA